jgi:hypothetical protein
LILYIWKSLTHTGHGFTWSTYKVKNINVIFKHFTNIIYFCTGSWIIEEDYTQTNPEVGPLL